jgi:signal transduction histidine kinase
MVSMEGTAPPSTILLVDDDLGLLSLMTKALQREGFRTATAASGRDALTWLARQHAELMLLDLKLPDLEAKELIQQLGAAGHCPPFIIITGQGDERVAVEMMKRGALDYLVKDVDFLQFVPAVAKRALEQLDRERRLAAAEAQRQRLEQEILEISDRERHRIGQDLHDGLCQQLAGIELMSQVLEKKLAFKSKGDAARAGDIAQSVRQAISDTRRLAQGLSPVTLESEGLMSALSELAANSEKMFAITCRCVCPAPVLVHNSTAATHWYRIAQEAVSNAARHGQAREVEIELKERNGQIVLSVSDNGLGFPDALPKKNGMGLHLMRYRAGALGGHLSVEKRPGGGIRVLCSAPAEAAQDANGP